MGFNCSLGSQVWPYIQDIATLADIPVSIYPNAGLPNGMADMMILQNPWRKVSANSLKAIPQHRRRLRGTTEHIAAIADAVADKALNGIRPDAVLYLSGSTAL